MTEPALIILGSVTAALLAAAGVYQLLQAASGRRRAVAAAEFHTASTEARLLDDLDRRFVRMRVGGWLARELDLAGSKQRPVMVFGVGLLVATVVTYFLLGFAPLLAALGLLVGYLAIRAFLRRSQQRRREAFLAQLPELARVLANASHAGLSLPTAVAIAGDELAEPARTELSRVATRLNFGAPLQTALDELQDRIGSRETKVLISTLIVAARSGGSLVSALRDIALTLDERKETRREIQSTLSQAIASANLAILLGFGMLLLVNTIEPGTVDRMTREPIGQVALVAGGGLFIGGWLLIRRITKVDL